MTRHFVRFLPGVHARLRRAYPALPALLGMLTATLAAPMPAAAADAAGATPPAGPATASPHAPRTLAEGNTRPGHGTGAATTDRRITEEIMSRLAGDERLKEADIHVETSNGSVTLSGRSPTDEGRQAAEEVAQQVEGVTRVDNRISSPSSATTVGERSREALKRTEEVASDSWITTKIRSAILADPLTRSSSGNIGIKTIDGVVTLTGSVATQGEFDRVVRIVHDIRGVKQVDTSQLQAGKEE